MATVGVRTTHRALSLHDSLFHSQFIQPLHTLTLYITYHTHLYVLALTPFHCYVIYLQPLLIHVTCNLSKKKKTFKLQIQRLKKHKNIVNFYRLHEVCKQFWVNSNMQTKLHFFIGRSSPVPLIFKVCVFIRSNSCPPIILAMTRSQKWTQDMAKITILYLHISYHPKINIIQIHKADMVLIITFQEMSQNFHLYGIWYTVMRFPFFTLKNLVSHDDDAHWRHSRCQ